MLEGSTKKNKHTSSAHKSSKISISADGTLGETSQNFLNTTAQGVDTSIMSTNDYENPDNIVARVDNKRDLLFFQRLVEACSSTSGPTKFILGEIKLFLNGKTVYSDIYTFILSSMKTYTTAVS